MHKPRPFSYHVTAAVLGALILGKSGAAAADWPTYAHDSRRSSVSVEQLQTPLTEDWVFKATHPPSHAWPDPNPKPVEELLELPRLRFDDAFHVAAVGSLIYFGSSSDNKVYALDAKTGAIRWTFYTDGPVRLAPTVWDSKVYVGSDDGRVYCLDAGDGSLIWAFSAAPGPEQVLGNGKMISTWPVRTGVLVDDGVAYFGAGVFPSEGLYLYALNAENGKLFWKNDSYGDGGSGTLSPQGYTVASQDRLFVSSGRSMPIAFNRKTGRLEYHRRPPEKLYGGGTYSLLAGNMLFNGTEHIVGFQENDARILLREDARRLVVDSKVAYLLTGHEAIAIDQEDWQKIQKRLGALPGQREMLQTKCANLESRLKAQLREDKGMVAELDDAKMKLAKNTTEGQDLKKQRQAATKWRVPCKYTDSIALTPGAVYVGGANEVKAFDTGSGREVWSAKVNGKARGMAIANGRLLVSTDQGSIHCFIPGNRGRGLSVTPHITAEPFPEDELTGFYASTADAIVKDSKIKRGYALVLGAGGGGRLALELAKRTELMIYVVEPDADKVAKARKALTDAGVYGGEVVVMQHPLDALPHSDYFANLIICEAAFFSGTIPTPAEEILRLLKPCGGVAYVGRPPSAGRHGRSLRRASKNGWLKDLRNRLDSLGEQGTTLNVEGSWLKVSRGPLNGAGSWTHQYANAGNTTCSDDQLVSGPLGVLWYGKPGPARMPNRHLSAPAPLSVNGRLFIQGVDVIMAYDAYNGLLLWEREIAGASRRKLQAGKVSNLAANDNSLFVVAGGKCLRLDAATGKTLRTYAGPPDNNRSATDWGDYIACVNALLYGADKQRIFAVEIESGNIRWVHNGKHIMANTICVADARVFFVDRVASKEQRQQCLAGVKTETRIDRRGNPIEPDVRLVVALNADTGTKKWESPQYVSDCVKAVRGAGGDLVAMYANNVLLLCGQPWNGHFWQDFIAGEFSRRSLIALAADSGQVLWSGRKGYRSRPLIVGDRIIAEPWAHDLKTGAEKMRIHPVTGAISKWQISRTGHHCGMISAAQNALFFRSAVPGYYDLNADHGTAHFGGQRPGCWINTITANGLAMMPEASSGCVCSYSLQCTTVYHPRRTRRIWGTYSAVGKMTPVKRLAVNFGAPGDRRAADGTLWLAYPRPYRSRLALDFPAAVKVYQGDSIFASDNDSCEIDGTDTPWIYRYGYASLAQFVLQLAESGEVASDGYTVRLHFIEPDDLGPGQRVFSVSMQGRTVLKDFDIAREAGGKRRVVVKTFTDVKARDTLHVSFSKPGDATGHGPVLCGIEVMANQFALDGRYDGEISFNAPTWPRAGEPYALTDMQLRNGVGTRGKLRYRHDDTREFSSIPLKRVAPGRFEAVMSTDLTWKPFVYYVELEAADRKIVRAPAGDALVRVIPDAAPPSPVEALTVARATNFDVKLTWKPAHDDSKVVGYRIYKKGQDDEASRKVAELPATALTFTDREIAPGKTIHYEIRAVDGVGRLGESRSMKVTIPKDAPPTNELRLMAWPDAKKLHLRWQGRVEPDVTEILVFRGVQKEGPFRLLETLNDHLATGWTDETQMQEGVQYWYTLKLRDKSGFESEMSAPTAGRILPMPDVHISDLTYLRGIVGWGRVEKDMNAARRPLKMGGQIYKKGLGVHADSELVYALNPKYKRFVAMAGLDDRKRFKKDASVTTVVYIDGKRIAESPVLRGGDPPWLFDVTIPEGAKQIKLAITGANDGIYNDMADWINAGFVTASETPRNPGQ